MAPVVGGGEVVAPGGPFRSRAPRLPAVRAVVSSVWVSEVRPTAPVLRVLPDAAVDLVFAGGRLRVAGPDTTACIERLAPGPVLGFHLEPGAVPAVLGVPASAVRDDRVDLAELWGDDDGLLDRLRSAPGTEAAADVLEQAIAHRVADAPPVDGLPAALAARLRPRATVGRALLEADLGVGERQLRRRCTAAFGFGPKVLARVLRFQAALDHLGARPDDPLAVVALDAGYVDQSHLHRDVTEFSGLTPAQLRRALAPPGVRSVQDDG